MTNSPIRLPVLSLLLLTTSCADGQRPNNGGFEEELCLIQAGAQEAAIRAVFPSLQIQIPTTSDQGFLCPDDVSSAGCEESLDEGCSIETRTVVVGQSASIVIRFRHVGAESSIFLVEFLDESCTPSPFSIVPGVEPVDVDGDSAFFHTEARVSFAPVSAESCEATLVIETDAFNLEDNQLEGGAGEILIRIRGNAVSP